MKVKALNSLCFALAMLSAIIPTCAQEILNEPNVPDNVRRHFFRGQRDIDIDGPSTRVVDRRRAESQNNLTVVVGAPPVTKYTNNIVNLKESEKVQSSYFGSHISPANPASNLKPGQISHVLAPTSFPKPGELIHNQSLQAKGKKLNYPSDKLPNVDVARYPDQYRAPHSLSKIETEVYGKIKSKPGDLLHQQ